MTLATAKGNLAHNRQCEEFVMSRGVESTCRRSRSAPAPLEEKNGRRLTRHYPL